MSDYLFITHKIPMWLLPLWKLIFCKRGWHAWDEVVAIGEHYLSCDACGMAVNLAPYDNDEYGIAWEGTRHD